jgi:hypothetical protein
MNKLEIITLNKSGISDFAKERNLLLKKSKAKWVFFVDTDETASLELMEEVRSLTSRSENKYNGYFVLRNNYFLGEFGGTDNIIRLGKRNSGWWQRRVHEEWKIKGSIGQLKNPLVHNTAKDLHEFINKINSYSTLHAQENLKSGKRSSIFRIIFFPPLKFVQSIVTGRGFIMSMLQSFHSFLSWSKEWTLQND